MIECLDNDTSRKYAPPRGIGLISHSVTPHRYTNYQGMLVTEIGRRMRPPF